MRKTILFASIIYILFIGCDTKKNPESKKGLANEQAEKSGKEKLLDQEKLVDAIEKAHKKDKYLSIGVIQFDLSLVFGGKQRFKGQIAMTPNGGLVKMKDASKTLWWDGSDAYLYPDTSSYKKTRFDVLTWSYFFAAPYKLSDPGTNHEFLGETPLNEDSYTANKLTFNQGVGDSSDDWYIVYKNQADDLLAAMAYIVTYSNSKTAAEEDPHAITYEAYVDIDGIPFATQWNFWTWNKEGELNKLLGEAVISNIKFTEKAEAFFKPTVGSRKVEKPNV